MGLLDRFNTISPLSKGFYGGAPGAQYRRQEEAYGQALRLLRREARRGDAGSALAEIKVRDQAMESGFSPGGIQSAEGRLKGAQGFASAFAKRAAARNEAADIREQRNREERAALGGQGAAGDFDASQGAEGTFGAGAAPTGMSQPRTPGLDAQERRLGTPTATETTRLDDQAKRLGTEVGSSFEGVSADPVRKLGQARSLSGGAVNAGLAPGDRGDVMLGQEGTGGAERDQPTLRSRGVNTGAWARGVQGSRIPSAPEIGGLSDPGRYLNSARNEAPMDTVEPPAAREAAQPGARERRSVPEQLGEGVGGLARRVAGGALEMAGGFTSARTRVLTENAAGAIAKQYELGKEDAMTLANLALTQPRLAAKLGLGFFKGLRKSMK